MDSKQDIRGYTIIMNDIQASDNEGQNTRRQSRMNKKAGHCQTNALSGFFTATVSLLSPYIISGELMMINTCKWIGVHECSLEFWEPESVSAILVVLRCTWGMGFGASWCKNRRTDSILELIQKATVSQTAIVYHCGEQNWTVVWSDEFKTTQ